MNYGQLLMEERIKKNVTKKQLSEMTGFSQRAIYYWERGERIMSIESADKVFEALRVTVQIGEKQK